MGQQPPLGGRRDPRRLVVIGLAVMIVAAAATAVVVMLDGGDERVTEVRGTTVSEPTTAPTTTIVHASFADLVQDVRSGLARIDATTCGDGTGTGTGFLVDRTHVLTVAHVVDDAAGIAVVLEDDKVRVGKVVGFDAVKEVALLELDRGVDGHVFELAVEPVQIGTEVAALGYPVRLPLTFTRGTVSGLDRTIDWDDRTLEGLIQTDTAINPGNSGGPLMTLDGRVRGLVEAIRRDSEGLAFAVASDTAIPLVRRWRATPDVREPADCERPEHPGEDVEVTVEDEGADAAPIAQALTRYFRAINDGEYDEAWAQYSPAQKERVPRDPFAAGLKSSYDFDITVHSTEVTGNGAVTAHVTFTSVQRAEDGPEGQECTDWSLDYRMVRSGGRWTIDGTTGHAGAPKSAACTDDE